MEWQFSRTYTDENGVTRIEELTFDKNPELKTLQQAKGIRFNVSEPGTFRDYHVQQNPTIVITLQGEGELGFKDGTKFHISPGHVNFATATSGEGHTSRVVGDVPRITVAIPLG